MSRNKKKSSNKRKLHKTSKKVNQNRISTTPNTGQTSTTPSTGQTSTTPNTGQTSTPKKKTNQYEKSAAKNKPSDKEIVEVDRGQTSTTPNIGQTSTPKKKTNQYKKSAANRDELSDEVEIVKVARGQTSTTPATGQSKTSRDLEESHTDKEMASAHFPKSSFEHTRTIKSRKLSLSQMPHRDSLSRAFLPYDFSSSSVEPSESLAYRYNNSDYEKLKRGELNELRQDYIKLHSHNKYINHENEVLRAEINYLKSQISSQDDADVKSLESESNDNDNRPGKKRKVVRRQIDQSDDDSETDEENARTEMKQINDWLAALHKHRRARLLYVERGVIDKDNRRLHKNNRLSETEVLNILKDTRYHSPEDSETDKEQPDGKRKIIVYNLSWRSDEAYKTQNMPVDTDFSGPDTPAENHESQSQTDDNTQTEHND
ncbi:hypothetical protein GLOIN_2v1766266 [Rhizophagus irregularis DAOM 181602=DAOM 197198]|uniref:Uncharacterized protein n=1 Tax=Rhizophagus irregularis (strain DAOM 181602 / DAOM 197198 / MUCL 43194) TaxID=747089 RepID=A0A2P4QMX6_RHIID|nr:hypothetical protein GLOIN_2v1766266 [Rhizophagus irregularis DAOM 181602=DAOM 197198]POG78938.1 hypothetical protein GLOIN_2v1766266 [Rhizophagus irregularis DAOM 181602=DAOM 197198]|eukprot:XP_025185804.1 hypothetical protein GLOIN_2v1766266 [Rhizophagus irregularis DAOM 181602=DAOM 197198]